MKSFRRFMQAGAVLGGVVFASVALLDDRRSMIRT